MRQLTSLEDAKSVAQGMDLFEYIDKYVQLKKTGSSYLGLCPFHKEKTPSFRVFQNTNKFHCFGCSEHGDIIDFAMKYHNVEFFQALKELGLEVKKDTITVPDSIKWISRSVALEEMYKVDAITFECILQTGEDIIEYVRNYAAKQLEGFKFETNALRTMRRLKNIVRRIRE